MTKTWAAMTDYHSAVCHSQAKEPQGTLSKDPSAFRINKGQSRVSSDSIARESQHRSAGRENSGRLYLDAIIMDRPNKTKREGDRRRARGYLAALNELDVKA